MARMKKHISFILIVSFISSANTQTVVCSCDLTGNACDANCCCDTDCTGVDVAAFVCSNETVNEDSKLCVNNLVFVNNRPSTSVVEDGGVFCIIRDSDTSRNFYNEPTLLNSTEDFDAAIAQYPTYSYDFTVTTPTSGPSYVTGDTIDIVHASGLRGKLGIPAAGVASNCIDGNPASFMTDQSVGCVRRFTTLPCTAGSVLDPAMYYSPNTFQISAKPITNTTEEATLVNITLCNSTESVLDVMPDGVNCLNAALEVSYAISYNGTSGISAACVSFTQGTVSGTSIFQTFNIKFIAVDTIVNTTFTRSGNPGYLVGKPLRTSSISSGNRTLVTDQLTLLSSEDGSCDSPSTSQQISFGEDQRTGCLLSFIRTTSCNDSLTRVRALLNVQLLSSGSVEVATFGNISVDSDGDWVPVTQRTAPETTIEYTATDTFGGGCASFLVGVHYYVFFANYGSISNPQPKIVGVQYQEVTENVAYQCNTADCQDGLSEHYVEISTSVTFIDMSSTPVTILKERPTVDARLPDDFFFPFTST